MTKMTEDERRWRRESDAHTLIEAEKINSDSTRKKAALGEVKRMVNEAEDALKTTRKVARKSRVTKKSKTIKRKKK